MSGPQPTRARLGVLACQVGCAHLVQLPLILFAPEILKYSEKNCIKFSMHYKKFYFWVIFLLHEKFRKHTKHGILFYLTTKKKDDEEFECFAKMLRPVFLHTCFTDILKMPPYAKYMKDIITNKTKILEAEISSMLANYTVKDEVP